MTPKRTFIGLSCLLLTLPAFLAPGALANVDPDTNVEVGGTEAPWGCEETNTGWLFYGRLERPGTGTWDAEGYAVNGCGGNGCDDAVEGDYIRSNGDRHDWKIWEVRTYEGCKISCRYQIYGSTVTRHEVDGYIILINRWRDGYHSSTDFKCGPDAGGKVHFSGWIQHPCKGCPVVTTVDVGTPSIEYGVE